MHKNYFLQPEGTAVGLNIHEVRPCTQRAEQESRLFLVQLCGFRLFFLHSYPQKGINSQKINDNLANAEITGA